ncbi:MAG: hypothetical protein V7721_11595 [Porticoccaceae bacterium]
MRANHVRVKGRSFLGWIVVSPFILVALAIVLIIIGVIFCEANKAYWDYRVSEICKSDGGMEIFEHILVSREGFLQMSKGNFKPKKYSRPNEILYTQRNNTAKRHNLIRITRTEVRFLRISDDKLIARYFHNARMGGDFPTGIAHGSSFSCPEPNAVLQGRKNIFVIMEG